MNIPIYQADAFTNKLFGGNPAAICPLDAWLPDETMQQIASENNLSETAFFVKTEKGYLLRWFTPEYEIDLCGHATLASAHILFTELGYTAPEIHFETLKAGVLIVSRNGDKYTLDFPSRPPEPLDILPIDLIKALGGNIPVEVLKSRDYLVVYETEEEVRELKPDFNLLAKLDTVGIIVTAEGAGDIDFVSRVFAPKMGVNEDPVTGSAHCSLIPYWAEVLQKDQLYAYQVSKRKGELWCELKGDRVLMSGQVVIYMRGNIQLNKN